MRRDTLEKYTCLRRSTGCSTVASRHRSRALRWACDNGSPVRLAEQQVDSRKAQGVSRKIDIHAETCVVVRATHRDLRQRRAEPPLRAIVRGTEEAALRR